MPPISACASTGCAVLHRTAPHHAGDRGTQQWAITNSLNFGAKALVAVSGGSIHLYGAPVAQRWTRLNATAAAGDTSLLLAEPQPDWRPGQRVLLTSTTYNPWQAEEATITAMSGGGTVLELEQPLQYSHSATLKAYPRAS